MFILVDALFGAETSLQWIYNYNYIHIIRRLFGTEIVVSIQLLACLKMQGQRKHFNQKVHTHTFE